jgi:hypothetical protein
LPTATASLARRSRSRQREGEVGDPVPPDVRLGVDPVGPPGPQRALVRQRVLAQHRDQAGGTGDEQVSGLGELDRQRRVQQVG